MSSTMRQLDIHHPAVIALRVIGDVANPVDDNIDLIVELKDGRSFSFTAFTPANLTRLMQNKLSFVSPGLLVVNRLIDEALIDAVTDAIEQGIEQFGVKQR
jgi:hypothetical protein